MCVKRRRPQRQASAERNRLVADFLVDQGLAAEPEFGCHEPLKSWAHQAELGTGADIDTAGLLRQRDGSVKQSTILKTQLGIQFDIEQRCIVVVGYAVAVLVFVFELFKARTQRV